MRVSRKIEEPRHEPDEAGDANEGETRHAPDSGQVVSCRQSDDLVGEGANFGTYTWQGAACRQSDDLVAESAKFGANAPPRAAQYSSSKIERISMIAACCGMAGQVLGSGRKYQGDVLRARGIPQEYFVKQARVDVSPNNTNDFEIESSVLRERFIFSDQTKMIRYNTGLFGPFFSVFQALFMITPNANEIRLSAGFATAT